MLYDYFHMRKNNKKAETNALFLSLQNKRITTRAVENLIKKYSKIAAPLNVKILFCKSKISYFPLRFATYEMTEQAIMPMANGIM